ncbi:MAG: ISNCY family transposase [Planctomycetota bacterium]
MEGHLLMSAKERRRKVEFECVRNGRQSIKDAAMRLELSYRHCRRSYKRFREEGDVGLAHRRRGRPSNRAKPHAFKEAVLSRYRERYEGFGPVLAMEKLVEEGYVLGRETLRRWLIEEGLYQPRRKGARHRKRRERKAHFGELVQMDGSHHKWFGGEQAPSCLMDMVDDATGTTLALMGEQETTELAMRTLWQWCRRYGIPRALYTDKKNVFVTKREPTIEEQLAGQQPLTEFGKACAKLDIEIIAANSPEAKGRVERKHGVFQDRFVKELRLKEIGRIEEANELLQNGFVETLNRKFARSPRSQTDLHRPAPTQRELREIFCFENIRVVTNDWTVRCENRFYQILKRNAPLPRPGDKVIVRRLLDGTIRLLYRDNKLKFKEIAQPAAPKGKEKPAPDHPWRPGLRAAAKKT